MSLARTALSDPADHKNDNARRGGLVIVCTDCGESVFEWSTPEPDRCWQCTESADRQAGG